MPAWGFWFFMARWPHTLPENLVRPLHQMNHCQRTIRGRMTPPHRNPALLLWVTDSKSRDFLAHLLDGHEYAPQVVGNPSEALQALKGQEQATVFVDCQTVSIYGPGLYAKLKVASPRCRVVLLCDKAHLEHRDICKEAMDLGIYACLLAPFEDWEVLAMVRHGQAARSPGRRSTRTREKN